MKQVIQLDDNGYFTGVTVADPSPLEPSVYLMPADTVDADVPTVPDGHLAKWDGSWVFEAIIEPEVAIPPVVTDEDKARAERNMLLMNGVDPIVSNPLRWAELTSEQQTQYPLYRRALLDITAQAGFPTDITWPTKPA
jgi:hypothetical protein